MTPTLSLVKRADLILDQESLDLLGYISGIELAADGWTPAVMLEDDESVYEELTLRVRGTSHDDIASKVRALDKKIVEANRYLSGRTDKLSVWLRDQKDAETYQRQALVRSIKGRPSATFAGPLFNQGKYIHEYSLSIERGHWEDTAKTDQVISSISAIGGVSSVWTVHGDYTARLAEMTIAPLSVAGTITRTWVGFRSNRFGTLANFKSKWEIENGSLSTDAATTTANDSTASGISPKSVRVSFATQTGLVERVKIGMSQVTTDYGDQVGEFIVLLRAKVNDGSTVCRVRLSSGYFGATNWNTRELVTVSGTGWNIYELGTVKIPEIGRSYSSESVASRQALRLEAQRVSGSSTLDLDCLILVPYDEGFVYTSGGQIFGGGTTGTLVVSNGPDGELAATGHNSVYGAAYYDGVAVTLTGGVPVGTTGAIVVGANAADSNINDTLYFVITTYERWATLRGNDT